jgi:hypothetical protein
MKNEGIKNILENNTPFSYKPLLSDKAMERLKTGSSIALAIIASAGIITLSAVAPNVIGAIGKLTLKRKRPLGNIQKKTAETFYYLKKSGLINIKRDKKDFLISLTELGRKKTEELNLNSLYIPKPKTWDKRWWLVAADIPTRDHRSGADLLRRKLKEMGFYPLQRTLWVYPHDPKQQLQFIINTYGINHFVTLMQINKLDKEDEKAIRKFFKKNSVI